MLRGKCSSCGVRISARYPLVEIAGGAARASPLRGGSARLAGARRRAGFCWVLLALTLIDFDTQLLPDNLTLPLLWAGLIANASASSSRCTDALLGAVAGYLVLWSSTGCSSSSRGKEGMGYGDFKLLAALGAWLGWQMLPLIILLSSVVGAVVGIALIVLRGRDRNMPMPFGPYLAVAGALALFFGPALVTAYLG